MTATTHWSDRAHTSTQTTPHNTKQTPTNNNNTTKAAMKATTIPQVQAAGSQFILSNTYHLMLQPGPEEVAAHGGLHRFTSWDGPMLTGSGGFQVFSLAHGGVVVVFL